jgi:iron complex outermembrane receptor protein
MSVVTNTPDPTWRTGKQMGIHNMSKSTAILGACPAIALLLAFASAAHAGAADQSAAGNQTATNSGGLEEIVVTARRREESAQTVPVSLQAFTPQVLERTNVLTLDDVSFLTPGLRVSSEGGPSVSAVSMRGLGKLPVGDSTPAVVIYFDEANEPNSGIDIPIYDVSSVQVLKGPQGTLFGKNALGGAILLTSKAPGFDNDGYMKVSYGNFNYRAFEGAIDLPLVNDLLAVRVSTQIHYRDGWQDAVPISLTANYGAPFNSSYTVNVPGGKPFGSVDQKSARVSFLLTPTQSLSNTLVLDYFTANEQPEVPVAYASVPGFIAATFAGAGPAFAPIAAGIDQAVARAVANQIALGPDATIRKPGIPYTSQRETLGVINTTKYEINDNLAIKNIFAYRRAKTLYVGHTDDIPVIPGPAGYFTVYAPSSLFDQRDMKSEELQLQGKAYDGKLDFTVGAIASWDAPYGAIGTFANAFQFNPTALEHVANYTTQQVGTNSQAVYAQGTLDLSQWTVQGLKFTLGARDGYDQAYGCGVGSTVGYVTLDQCRQLSTEVRLHDSSEPSDTISLDWQVNNDLLAYIASRRSYRGVSINVPLFYSQYTTGGTGCLTPNGQCPDLRPFQGTKPDWIIDYEGGVKSDFRLGEMPGRFNIALYQSNYHNLVEFVNYQSAIPATAPDAPQSGSVGENVANVTIRGIELETSLQPMPGLTFSFDGAFTAQTTDKLLITPAQLGLSKVSAPSPRFSGTVSAEYVIPTSVFGGKMAFNLADYYTTPSFQQVGYPTPGYNLLTPRVDLKNIQGSGFSVGLWARNALNRTYISAPVVVYPVLPVESASYGEPRMYGIDIGYDF